MQVHDIGPEPFQFGDKQPSSTPIGARLDRAAHRQLDETDPRIEQRAPVGRRFLAQRMDHRDGMAGLRLTVGDRRNHRQRAGAERAAINAPMQGTAADIIKLAMVAVEHWIEREGLQSRLLLQVHDELILEVPDAELERVRAELPPLMTQVAQLRAPLLVEVGVGANWDEAH